jgi:hypothetical protein
MMRRLKSVRAQLVIRRWLLWLWLGIGIAALLVDQLAAWRARQAH